MTNCNSKFAGSIKKEKRWLRQELRHRCCLLFLAAFAVLFGNAQPTSILSLKPAHVLQQQGRMFTSYDSAGWKPYIGRAAFNEGVNTIANSEITYIINKKYDRFTAMIGLQDMRSAGDTSLAANEWKSYGSVVFFVYADGNKIYESTQIRVGDSARAIKLDVHNSTELTLVVKRKGGGSADYSKGIGTAVWADPILIRTAHPADTGTKPVSYTIKGGNRFFIQLDQEGTIIGALYGVAKNNIPVKGFTELAQCSKTRFLGAKRLAGGGMQFRHSMRSVNGDECILTQQFVPMPTSVEWNIDLSGKGAPWSSSIITTLKWPVADSARYWTTWSSPDLDGEDGKAEQWTDPLVTRPFMNSSRWFGGNPAMSIPYSKDIFSVPIVTVIDSQRGFGLSMVQSPDDTLLYMKLITSEDGTLQYQRRYHRISKGNRVHFSVSLVCHADDWRSGMKWMEARYPEYFEPKIDKAYDVGGGGAYSSWEGVLDTVLLKKIAFKTNWKASFDFPYMGMFIPPVEHWQTFATSEEAKKDPWVQHGYKGAPTSRRQLAAYSKRMYDYGFHVLNYFNVTEFGTNIKSKKALTGLDPGKTELWKDPNQFLYNKISDGILYDEAGSGQLYMTWGRAVVMDPGAKDYQDFLVNQAQLHVNCFPYSSGICIDRMDWLRFFNTHADDGVSWYNDKPVRSLFISWRNIMERIGPIMHSHQKVVFANPMVAMRLDMMKEIDGIYSEHNDRGPALNASSFLGMDRPVMAWTWNEKTLLPDPDQYMQRLLYLGVFPSVPFPDNNHEILPGTFADTVYLKYGPLFNAIMKRRWVLDPHVIQVSGKNAKANLFKVPGGFVAPVVLADQPGSPIVVLLNMDVWRIDFVDVLLPGEQNPVPINIVKTEKGALQLTVPVKDRCALVRIHQKKQ